MKTTSPDILFFEIQNNLFLENTAIVGGCFDLETSNSIFLLENNIFLLNYVISYQINGVGAGAVLSLAGYSLIFFGKNNSYIGNYGMLKGN